MTQTRPDLPGPVRDLALRCGARPDTAAKTVVLNQTGFLQDGSKDAPQAYKAHQTIDLTRTAFDWAARSGPADMMVARDELSGGVGKRSISAFGVVPVASVSTGPEVTRDEILRYLTELPWAPDAILLNLSLVWRVLDSRTLMVSAGEGAAGGEVTLRIGDEGFVTLAETASRPRREGACYVERPWRGRFSTYVEHQGRQVPTHGVVGWIVGATAFDRAFLELQDWSLQ